ncbi:MAG: leucine-rich repeat protein [Clostridiales bacterium]|jgi:uncharacterized repeat protein (TIGR02543 family)|nr:leucine-rich repeat protein [Clostridiales bacterium]
MNRNIKKPKIKIILLLTLLCLIAALSLSACKVKTYKVTFLSDGAFYEDITVKRGETITLPTAPTKWGYIFEGWLYSNDTFKTFDGSEKITSDITVTAEWTLNETPTDGLFFTPIEGGYKVSVGEAANEAEIVIPRKYEDEPILEIDNSFSVCTKLARLMIPFVGETLNGIRNVHFGYIFGASDSDYNLSKVPVSLKEVIVSGETSIGSHAFNGCVGLTSITLPDVTNIGDYVFQYCSGLTVITLPNVTSIGKSTFSSCRKLTSITLSKVTSIGDYAFYYCSGLTTIMLHNATSIGEYAFAACSGLTVITIPYSVISIQRSAFYEWASSQTIYIKGRSSAPEGWSPWWGLFCSAKIVWNA